MNRAFLEFDPSATKSDALLCKTSLSTGTKNAASSLKWNSAPGDPVKIYSLAGKKLGQAAGTSGRLNPNIRAELQLNPGVYLLQQGNQEMKKVLLKDF
jgi:hypothetical protein